MEVLMEYHMLFMAMAFCLFILTLFLLFYDPSKERVIAAMIVIGFNLNLCWINALSFFAINIYGFDTSGVLVTNAYHDMYMFFAVFFGLFFTNVALLFYCPYLIGKQPWQTRKFEREPRLALK